MSTLLRSRSYPFAFALAFGLGLVACDPSPIDAVVLDTGKLQTGMVAHWTFDDGFGTVALDTSGNNHAGVLEGGTWLTEGRFGGALHLEKGESVTVLNFPDATTNWSVSVWVRFTDPAPIPNGFVTVLGTESLGMDSPGGWELNLFSWSVAAPTITATAVHFSLFSGPGLYEYDFITCFCLQPGVWTHTVTVVDGEAGTLSLYVDGRPAGPPTPIAHPIIANHAPLFMGKWSHEGRLYTGDIDDTTIYDRILSPEEIDRLHVGVVPPLP